MGIFAGLAFVFGTIIGSFLNVVSLRYNTGKGIGGKSFCFSCGKHLHWYELVPILSFAIQKGRCRNCQSRISPQYPLVEIFTGLIFTALFFKFNHLLFISPAFFEFLFFFFGTIMSILIIISIYDMRHTIIPDKLVFLFMGFSFASLFLGSWPSMIFIMPQPIDLLAGPILAAPFAILWLVSGGKWMGLGDAKLALGIGFLLGFLKGIATVMLSFWLGAAIGIVLLLLKRGRITIKSEMPFAPYLVLGAMISFFTHIDLYALISLFGR